MNHDPLETLPIAQSRSTGCCAGWRSLTGQRAVMGILIATTTLAALVAAYFAGAASHASRIDPASESAWLGLPIANATAAVSSEKFSMCTGPLAESNEALFVLDHNSGLL